MSTKASGLIPGYETTFIARVDMSDDQLKTLKERLKAAIASFGGEVLHEEDWGKRKLAYPIERETRGQYVYTVYTGKGEVVKEVERTLKINDHILRYLSVNLDSEFDTAEFMKKPTSAMLEKHEEKEPYGRGDRREGYREYREYRE